MSCSCTIHILVQSFLGAQNGSQLLVVFHPSYKKYTAAQIQVDEAVLPNLYVKFCSFLVYQPLHSPSAHSLVSLAFPEHPLPPCAGGGLVQVLERSWTPFSHVTLHSPQSPKSLHPPFTVTKKGITHREFERRKKLMNQSIKISVSPSVRQSLTQPIS